MSRYFRIKFGRKTVRPFKKEDIDNILVICKKRKQEALDNNNEEQFNIWDRNHMIIVLGINLAFRIEDILQLKINNIRNGYVYIRELKTGKEQSFEIHPSLAKDIEKYINRHNFVDGEYLFQSRQGTNQPITRQRAWQIIKKLANEVGVNYPVAIHSLRKYFARRYYEETGDIIGLKEMLNHSSERVTLLYICWEQEMKDQRRKDFYLGS